MHQMTLSRQWKEMGENIYKSCIWQGINVQNIQKASKIQQKQTIQLKNGQRIPKKIYKEAVSTWKDA